MFNFISSLLLGIRAQDGYSVSLKQELEPTLTIATSNFSAIAGKSGCRIGLDETVIVYCNEEKFIALD